MRRAVRRFDWLLTAILVGGALLRLWGISDRLPSPDVADNPFDDTAVDEGDRRAEQYAWDMWAGGTRPLRLDPGTGDWPGLPFYLTLGSQMAYRAYDHLLEAGGTAESFRNRCETRPAGIFLAGRLLSLPFGILSIALVYLLGLALTGRAGGLMAAAFIAVMPLHVFLSQRIFDPNLLSFTFMTGAWLAMARSMRTRAARDSVASGALVGLAAASKYMPAVLVAPLALVHVERLQPVSVRWRPLVFALGAVALSFALTSPFTLLDPSKLGDIREQSERLRSEWAGLSSSWGTLPTYLLQTLPEALTWVGYLLALAGCVLLWRRGREGRVVLVGTILFLGAISTLGIAQPRFVAPILGALAVAAAACVLWLAARAAPRAEGAAAKPSRGPARSSARVRQLIPAAAATVAVLWGVAQAVSVRERLSRPDSRYAAHAWIASSIDPHIPLALDSYGPVLRRGPGGRCATPWPFHTWQTEYELGAFHPEWLDGIRYYVISSEVTRRYRGDDPRYAPERAFYGWIRSRGVRVWATDPRTMFGPEIEVFELPRAISTKAERDSIWVSEPPTHTSGREIPRWAGDLAEDFLTAGDLARAEEWARRGMSMPGGPRAPGGDVRQGERLFETLSGALIQERRFQDAEESARRWIESFPGTPLPHVFRGMALESLGRPAEALAEYRTALPMTEKEDARRFLEAAIARLEGPAGSRQR